LSITGVVVVVVAGGAMAAYALVSNSDSSSAGTRDAAAAPQLGAAHKATKVTKRLPTTTTTTVPPVAQPHDVNMPAPGRLGYGSRGALVQLYEARMRQLHFDPGPVDGVFDQDTQYAVIAVQKYYNQPRTGVIDTGVQWALSRFRYSPALPTSEADRVEVDLDRQVVTVFKNWQPILITTASTGSGEHFCGGADGPASHGCTRIPMHIANYFYTLVYKGESVFVVGTPKQPGNGYVGPIPTPPPASSTTVAPTTVPAPTTPTTKKPTSTTPTTKKPTTTTKP
jgi:peptidoglycan hydrolase-like protein with peptidoglycan-binding domain